MCESLGVRLRQRREEQGIALSTIADQTKIKLSLLESLERDDVSRWPSGIFRRAFIRAYAHAIGLQPDAVVRDFLEQHPDPLEEVTTAALAEAVDAASMNAAPPTRLRYLVGAAVGSLSRLRTGHGHRRIVEVDNRSDVVSGVTFEAVEVPEPFAAVEEAAQEGPELFGRFEMAEADEIPAAVEPVEVPAVSESDAPVPTPFQPDLSAVAALCTEFARIDDTCDLAPLLERLAETVEAVGLIVWLWDPQSGGLTPALPHGYSDDVLAQLPNLRRDARNATAAAFRSAETRVVSGGDAESDAMVVPLVTPAGCAGVLAIELQNGAAQNETVRALATILAAQVARVVAAAQPALVANRRLA